MNRPRIKVLLEGIFLCANTDNRFCLLGAGELLFEGDYCLGKY
jgi:hypothetical protein